MNSGGGLFITIEGCEAAGKSTLIAELYDHLDRKEHLPSVIKSYEPGATQLGERMREILLDKNTRIDSSRAELYLFLASRAEHVVSLITPALNEGLIVLCDRFTDSSMAYQCHARLGLEYEEYSKVCQFATAGVDPDITIYLDIDPEVAFSRMDPSKMDRMESEKIEFHRKVREGYLQLAARFTDRIIVIDASQKQEDVLSQTKEKLDKAIEKCSQKKTL